MKKRIIKALIPNFLKEALAKRMAQFRTIENETVVWGGVTFKEILDTAAKDFSVDKERLQRLLPDIKKSYNIYGIRPHEYFMFRFEDKTAKERQPYLSDMTKDQLLMQYYGNNWRERLDLTKDKFGFYQRLKSFYQRDVILISSQSDFEVFSVFCKKHDSFIVKPLKGGGGKGISVVHLQKQDQIKQIFDELIGNGSHVIEELIQQDERLSEFCSSSVNSMRVPSFRHGDSIKIGWSFLRFGRNGSVIDNATSGGVFALADLDTGELISDAYDKSGHVYEYHPDTNKKFKGYRIPEWDQLLDVVKQAHLALSEDDVYVGFDVALSKKGWVIIEGNWGDIMCQQIALKRGLRSEFIALLNNDN